MSDGAVDETIRDDLTIALCLSGGGLRATLFHFGLIKALRAHSRNGITALAAVGDVYSISGGSIVAAHLVRNWQRYNGDDEQFAELEREILGFAGRNIRDRVVRRWLLTRWAGRRRTYWLQKEYEDLLGPVPISECYRASGTAKLPKRYRRNIACRVEGHQEFENE